ncbi:MAG: hypothetical protein QW394_05055, partial [Thermofilaceae archaeon]
LSLRDGYLSRMEDPVNPCPIVPWWITREYGVTAWKVKFSDGISSGNLVVSIWSVEMVSIILQVGLGKL